MKKNLLLLSLLQTFAICAMEKPVAQPSTVSPLDTLPPEIRAHISTFITGDTLDKTIKDIITKFYVASPESRKSVQTNKAILHYLMQRFANDFEDGKSLQKVADRFKAFPAFKNKQMLEWIEQQKERLNKENELREAASDGNLQKVQELIAQKINVNARANATPLIHAIQHKHNKITELLLENGPIQM